MFTSSSDMLARGKLNAELAEKEAGSYLNHDEKKALRRAEEAEEAFRASKGYPPKSRFARLRQKLFHP